jgi:hypothetical protein
MKPRQLKALIAEYTALGKKWDVWIRFESSLSKSFTEEKLLR